MKLNIVLLIVLTTIGSLFAQEALQVAGENPYEVHYCGDLKVMTNNSEIQISNEMTMFRLEMEGKKQVLVSPNEEYVGIVNFAFPEGKENYPIDMMVFDAEGTEHLRTSITGYYDMPHPLYVVTDGGELVGFDPLYAQFLITDDNGTEKIPLVENAEFEMERAGFIATSENEVYVALTNLAAASDGAVATLYKYDMTTKAMESAPLPFNNLMCMELMEDDIFISVLLHEDDDYVLAYSVYDTETLEQEFLKKGNGIELIAPVNDGYVATYSNKLYLLDDAYNIVKTDELGAKGRIQSIMPSEAVTYFLFTNAEDSNSWIGKIRNDFSSHTASPLKGYQIYFIKMDEKDDKVFVNGDGMSVEVK